MLQLYYDRYCPFCQRVLGFLKRENIGFEPKEFSLADTDSPVRSELIELGGKPQVPFLVDTSRGVHLYESGDILDYLEQHYVSN